MFHPRFRKRSRLSIATLSSEAEFRAADVPRAHKLVARALMNALDATPRRAPAISDELADLFLCAMSGRKPNYVTDPFGIYGELASLPPDVIQDLYNQFLTPDEVAPGTILAAR